MNSSDDEYSDGESDQLTTNSSQPPTTAGGAKLLGDRLADRNTIAFTAHNLFEMVHRSEIDLDPDYQRDVVWGESQQSLLIDSLMHNYYIPPVIFSVNTLNDGTSVRTCLDGKQRLTSIQRFFDGEIPWKCKEDKKPYFFKQGTNTKHRILPAYLANIIKGTHVTCVELKNLTDAQERETFQRVQNGKELKKDEKWQALTGKHPDLINKVLRAHVSCINGISELVPWDSKRGKDFSCVAEAIYRLSFIPHFTVKKGPTLNAWLEDSSKSPVSYEYEALAMETFQIFLFMVRDSRYADVFKKHKTLAPVEFIMIAVLIARCKDTLSLRLISEGIEMMRKDVRGRYADIKNRGDIKKVMYEAVDRWEPQASMMPSEETAAGVVRKKRKRAQSRSESPDTPLAKKLQQSLKAASTARPPVTPIAPTNGASTSRPVSTSKVPSFALANGTATGTGARWTSGYRIPKLRRDSVDSGGHSLPERPVGRATGWGDMNMNGSPQGEQSVAGWAPPNPSWGATPSRSSQPSPTQSWEAPASWPQSQQPRPPPPPQSQLPPPPPPASAAPQFSASTLAAQRDEAQDVKPYSSAPPPSYRVVPFKATSVVTNANLKDKLAGWKSQANGLPPRPPDRI